MADALVSALSDQLVSILVEEVKQEVRLVRGVKKEVEKLSVTFKAIQAVLNDAEERQLKDQLVKIWLEELKAIAYDMDDILDEWNTEIQKSKLEGARSSSVGMLKKVPTTYLFSACFCFKQLGLRHDIGQKIKDIREKLEVISTEKDKYNFIESSITKAEEKQERLTTSSLIDTSDTFGRDLDREIIVSKLLSESSQQDNSHKIPIISIVGMGGLGKTTLAQLAYNDEKVDKHFQKKMWVCVSDPFNRVKITKAIIKAVNETASFDDGDEWETLHHKLSKSVEGKLFLLVLDDVWTDDETKWDPLRLCFNRGERGSRIMVTTRSDKVSLMMGATYIHRLGKLSDDDCWSLLSHRAFIGREEERPNLEEIGMKIALKCKGLPLSALTLGSLLRFKKTKQAWQDVLRNDFWELSEIENGILPTLLLSYNDLPSHLKPCFAYCAIFPKDEELRKGDVIKMWMAQGFLSNSSTEKKRDLEMIGEEYFDNLLMRSFFQILHKYPGDEYTFNMHDLVHDVAQFLTKSECSIMELESNTQDLNCSNARHLTLKCNHTIFSPSSLYKAKNLRTLQFWLQSIPATFTINPSELFCHLTCLRALDLSCIKLEELPSEVEKLIHLRYLDLSRTYLKELPETVCNLHNLQTLKLEFCSQLYKLPKGLRRLINLRHLVLVGSESLSYLPQGIGRLSSLHTLSKFIVGGGGVDEGCKIGEIKGLNLLQGVLEIKGLGRVENANEANEAELKNKEHLSNLQLYFDGNDGGETVEERMEIVLEALQPHPNLSSLGINYYPGTTLPKWLVSNGDLLLSNLVSLALYGFKWKQLPPIIGRLPLLLMLSIGDMEEVKYIGSEFSGVIEADDGSGDGEVERVFPKLKTFAVISSENLEELDLSIKEADGRKIIFMPSLIYLTVGICNKLKALAYHRTDAISLEKKISMTIFDCPKLSWTPPSCCLLLPQIEKLRIILDAGELSKSVAPNNHICHLSNLKSLEIGLSNCSLFPEGLAQLTMLQHLKIFDCPSFTSLPEELRHLTNLQELEIENCSALEPRCQKEVGEDWSIISHIPSIMVHSSERETLLWVHNNLFGDLSLNP